MAPAAWAQEDDPADEPTARDGGAEEDPDQSIGGRISRSVDGEREPVEGVEMIVRRDGEVVGRDETDEDGEWRVGVPADGIYEVELDEETLPEDATLRNPDRNPLENVSVRPGQFKRVLFPLGERERTGSQIVDRMADLVAEGIRLGLIVALAAVGLTLIFGVTGLVNFAHGELLTLGGVLAFFLSSSPGGPGMSLVLAGAFAVVLAGTFGAGLEKGLWLPLRRRGTGTIARMVVSIGLSLFLRHITLVLFGGAPRPYATFSVQRAVSLGPVDLPPKDFLMTGLAAAVLVIVGVLLKVTRTGTAMRAVADNKDLAESSGIDVDRIILITWIAGTALAALAGVFYGASEVVAWDMGFSLLLIMFAAVILGGLGNAWGAMLGALLIGIISQTSVYWFPVEFKLVFALAVLILVLLVRPQGILGVKERIG